MRAPLTSRYLFDVAILFNVRYTVRQGLEPVSMAELNFNATLYIPMQPEDKMSDYAVWKELCTRMDKELADARLAWRACVQERDRLYREMKERSDELRLQCAELERRPKPPAPQRET